MGYTKLDRANTAKVQQVTGVPGSSTVGNIAVSSTGPSLYFKYNSLWYSVSGATSGIFEEGTGTRSTKRVNANITVSGNYSFGHAESSSILGDYSYAFGTNISLGGDYNLVTGSTQTINSASHYNAVFGYSHIFNSSANYNIAAGNNHTVDGIGNAFFGDTNTCNDSNNYYNLVSGRNHSLTAVGDSLVIGRSNTVNGSSYSLTMGYNNTNTENHTIVHGEYANAIWKGARHFSGVRMDGSTAGTSMGMDGLVLSAQTTGAETVDMTFDSLDGSGTNPLYCPDQSAQFYRAIIVAVSDGTSTGIKVYQLDFLIKRVDPAIFTDELDTGTLTTLFNVGSLGGTVTPTVDGSNYKVKIQAIGAGGQTINWTAHIYAGITVHGDYQTGS